MPLACWGAQHFDGPYKAESYRVIDGDSVEVVIAIWFGVDVTTSVRLAGIDAPESRAGVKAKKAIPACEIKAGKAATEFLVAQLAGHTVFIQDLKIGSRPGRTVGRLFIQREHTRQDASQLMLDSGHAVAYSGKKARLAWVCGV